jgi:hypothetical protein
MWCFQFFVPFLVVSILAGLHFAKSEKLRTALKDIWTNLT